MSRIRSKDTKPEELVRNYLFLQGFRYRKNDKHLPGKPDIVLPKYKAVVFVNGCFWHGHTNCIEYRLPKTNTEFWAEKTNNNILRDQENYKKLQELGWKVIVVWECEITVKGKFIERMQILINDIKKFRSLN